VYDAVIISDIHLGSDNCQAKSLCRFLESIANDELRTARLILNGDVFDSIDFRRLRKSHWKVLSLIRKLSDQIDIIWLCGNHDSPVDILSHLLGVTVQEEYVLESGPHRAMILHGHIFDDFLDAHPWLTWWSDVIYWLLQRIDGTHAIARYAKQRSKTFLRCAQKIEERSVVHARRKQCSVVCCGHTHQARITLGNGVDYYNSGCWTEKPSTYLTIRDGRIELHHFIEREEDEVAVVEARQTAGTAS